MFKNPINSLIVIRKYYLATFLFPELPGINLYRSLGDYNPVQRHRQGR